MSDIEVMTWENHERARARELGERWAYLKRLKERREKARKDGMRVAAFTSAFSLGAAASFLAIGEMRAVAVFLIVSLLSAGAAWTIWNAR